jgi:hypothetical protein
MEMARAKVKITIFSVLGLVGLLASELTACLDDGKVTLKEAMAIVEKICNQLGIEFDKAGLKL